MKICASVSIGSRWIVNLCSVFLCKSKKRGDARGTIKLRFEDRKLVWQFELALVPIKARTRREIDQTSDALSKGRGKKPAERKLPRRRKLENEKI